MHWRGLIANLMAEKGLRKFESKQFINYKIRHYGRGRIGLLIQWKNSLKKSGKEIDLVSLW